MKKLSKWIPSGLAILLITFSLFLTPVCNGQTITTFAGNGTAGHTGDGGPATSAEITSPGGVTSDSYGNIYVCDGAKVRKISTSGTISTFAGTGTSGFSGDGGQATSAKISSAIDICTDASNNLYIVDGMSRIRKVSTSGIISTVAGNGIQAFTGDGGPATSAELYEAYGVVVDASGKIYINEAQGARVRIVNTSGTISTFAGNGVAGYSGDGGAATSAELHQALRVSVDPSGNVYISDRDELRVRMVNTSGVISTFAGNGGSGSSGDGGAATSAHVDPYGTCMDAGGVTYITDEANNRVRLVNTSGIIYTIGGNGTAGYSGDGGAATSAEFDEPEKPAIDNNGNLYIADALNNRIRIITLLTLSRSVTNVLCNGGTGSASVTASNGKTPYTYSWAPSGGSNSSSTALSAGTYTIYVSDNYGIKRNISIAITQPTAITITPSYTNVTCYGLSNGSVNETVSGGVSPYTYSWTGGGTSSSKTGLAAGTYTLTITDANGCTTTASAIISQPSPLSVSATATNSIICAGNPDSLSASVSGGVLPYTYLWTPSDSGYCYTCQFAITIKASSTIYTLTVTDNNGCTATTSKSITVNPLPTITITASSDSVSIGQFDTLTASSALNYLWNTGETTSSIIVSPYVSTMYSVSTIDANGCEGIADKLIYRLVSPTECYDNVVLDAEANGNGSNTFTITTTKDNELIVIFYGGGSIWNTIMYTRADVKVDGFNADFVQNTTNTVLIGQGIYTYSAPTANTYTIYCNTTENDSPFYDNYACSFYSNPCGLLSKANCLVSTNYIKKTNTSPISNTVTATILNSIIFSNFIQENCCDNSSTTIGPFTYSWTPSAGTYESQNAYANNLSYDGDVNSSIKLFSASFGTNTISVSNGASASSTGGIAEILSSVLIQPPPCFAVSASSINPIACDNNGSINVSVLGGMTPYTYSWSPNVSTSSSATGLSAGTYTIIVTDPCFDSQTIIVTLTSIINIISSNNSLVCAGTPITLSVTPVVSGYTYSWSTGETGTSITVSPTDCGPVTVTVTSGECSYTTSYVPSLLNPVLNGPSPTCSGSRNDGDYSLQYTVTNSCNDCTPNYTWSTTPTTGGIILTNTTGTITTVEIPYSSPALENGFTINVTATCGDLYCTQSLVINGCCYPSDIDQILTNNNLSDFDNSSTRPFPLVSGSYTCTPPGTEWVFDDFTSPVLLINGYFNVNEPLEIDNSEILMGPNAQIQVTTGASLTINNCYIHACYSMWDGIYLINLFAGGPPSLTVNNCLIEDAEHAVVSNGPNNLCPISITNSVLNKNYVSLDIENAGTSSYPLIMYSTDFGCNNSSWSSVSHNYTFFPFVSSVLDPNGPYAGQMSLEGVFLKNVPSITIGDPSNGVNNFINLYYGIVSTTGNLNVYNNSFQNISEPTASFTAYGSQGIAVAGIGNGSTNTYTTVVGGSSSTQNNTFQNCYIGVGDFFTMNLTMGNNTIYDSHYGAYLFLNNKCRFNIGTNSTTYYNTFSNVYTSVIAESNPGSVLNVSYNVMSGVNGVFTYLNPGANESILHNNITGTEGVNIDEPGFDTYPHPVHVSNNTINATSLGIYGQGFEGLILDNTINLTGGTAGIYLIPVKLSEVETNTVTCTSSPVAQGLWVVSPSSLHNSITCNVLTDANHEAMFTGIQYPSTVYDLNQMYNTTTAGSGIYLDPTGDIGQQGTPANGTGNYWDLSMATVGFPPYDNYNKFGLHTEFYISSALSGPTYYPPNNGDINIPFITSSGIDCGTCSGVSLCNPSNKLLAEQIIGDTHYYGVFNTPNHWSEKQNLFLDLKFADTTLVDSSSLIMSFYDSAQHSNLGYLVAEDSVLSDSNGVSFTDIMYAAAYNSAISSPDTVESIAHLVHKILISMYANGQVFADSTQADTLRLIAPLCPAIYGYGVLMARELLRPIDTTIYISTCEMPDSSGGGGHSPIKEKKDNIAANVFPNPANTQLTIQLIPQKDTPLGLEYFYLFDGLGNLVQKAELSSDLTTISLSQLSAGIYYYRIVDEKQNPIKTDNLIIMR